MRDERKLIIVTGARGQIGRVIVNHLSSTYEVCALDIAPTLDLGSAHIREFCVDITSLQQVKTFVSSLDQPIWGLVNNAGKGVYTDFFDRTPEELESVISVNTIGLINISRECLKSMLNAGIGRIISIGSIYGQVSSDPRIYGSSGRNNSEIYSMTKAGVAAFSRYIACNYGANGITANTISPGGIFNNQGDLFVDSYSAKVPAHRMGTPSDLLGAISLMLSEQSGYINGQNLVIDGGLSAW